MLIVNFLLKFGSLVGIKHDLAVAVDGIYLKPLGQDHTERDQLSLVVRGDGVHALRPKRVIIGNDPHQLPPGERNEAAWSINTLVISLTSYDTDAVPLYLGLIELPPEEVGLVGLAGDELLEGQLVEHWLGHSLVR